MMQHKKTYTSPTLAVHGSVEEITKGYGRRRRRRRHARHIFLKRAKRKHPQGSGS